MKERNISIDILKCIAAILITNSHMGILYPNSALSTGGAIGNALFFFCSGFTLFLKPLGRFDNFYKKRINRIYPTVFAWAILATLFFEENNNIISIILTGGRWFVSCIMIHYVILYFINKTMINHLYLVSGISVILIIAWYFAIDKSNHYSIYGDTSFFRWGYYFLFILFGAILGISQDKIKNHFKGDFLKLIGCIVLYYGSLYIGKKSTFSEEIQIISLFPLLGIVLYFYKIGNSNTLKTIYSNKFSGAFIKIIGGLCLEIYLVQFSLFTNKMNNIFPLNLIIMFIIILIAAYILRCVSRLFSQIFKEQDLKWKDIFKLY